MKQTRDSTHITWKAPKIAKEFGMDIRTVGKRLKSAGLNPENTFTTPEVVKAIFGDIDSERLRKTREEADQIMLKNAQARGSVIDLADVEKLWTGIAAAVKQRILNIPVKIESQYRIGMNQSALRKLIERETDDALNELANCDNLGEPVRTA